MLPSLMVLGGLCDKDCGTVSYEQKGQGCLPGQEQPLQGPFLSAKVPDRVQDGGCPRKYVFSPYCVLWEVGFCE